MLTATSERLFRYLAIGGAATAAGLYLLVGLGVLYIGRSTTGGDADLFEFGVTAGTGYLVLGAAVLASARRAVLIPVALFNVLVIVAYFALAGLREPPYEIWGLAIKAAQLVMLAGLLLLALNRPAGQATQGSRRAGPMARAS